jgi:hypothetical protein
MSEEDDVLVRALRDLPTPDTSGAAQDRARREARAAFQRSAGRPRSALPGHRSFGFGSLAVPAVLAGVVLVYLGWAIATVNALAQ